MSKMLLTGASGFLGSIIKNYYYSEAITLSRTIGADICCDISSVIPKLPIVEVVVHCAGKAHVVPKSINEKKDFFDVNVNGTKNLLLGLERSESLPKSFVLISTVAVYGREAGCMLNEQTALLAKDPYGLSKIQAENEVMEWCLRNKVTCAILRLPLIAGPNPPGNLGSMIMAISKGYYFDIAGGEARKSIVLAEDVASIITTAAKVGGIYNLTDRVHPSFSELSSNISNQLGKTKPLKIPKTLAKLMAIVGDSLGKYSPINSSKLLKITNDLTFDDQAAVKALNWNPKAVLNGFKIN